MFNLSYCIFTAPYLPEDKSGELENLLKLNNLEYLTLFGKFGTAEKQNVKIPIYVVLGTEDKDVLEICEDCCKKVGTDTILVKEFEKPFYYYYINRKETEYVADYLVLEGSKYIKICETYFETIAFNANWIGKIIEFKGVTF